MNKLKLNLTTMDEAQKETDTFLESLSNVIESGELSNSEVLEIINATITGYRAILSHLLNNTKDEAALVATLMLISYQCRMVEEMATGEPETEEVTEEMALRQVQFLRLMEQLTGL